jgi:acetyl esterase/lipase
LRRQGFGAEKIALGGDSAGRGLTLTLLRDVRDAGEDLLGCAWLVSPWTDLIRQTAKALQAPRK